MHDADTSRDPQTAEAKDDRVPQALKRLWPLLLIGVAMAIVWQTGLHRYLSLEGLIENREALTRLVSGNLAVAVLGYVAVYIVTVALSLPGALFLTIAGGLMFGWAIAGSATVIAATLGASVIFLAAKTALGTSLRAKAGPFLDRLASGFEEDAFNYLLFLRLVPAFPFWLVNLAPAFLGVSLKTFFIATLIGIIPGTFAFAFVGAGLGSVIDAQAEDYRACQATDPSGATCTVSLDTSALITPEIIAAFVALGVVAIIPVIVKKVRKRRQAG